MSKYSEGFSCDVVNAIAALTNDCSPKYSAAALLLTLSRAPPEVQNNFWSMIFQTIQHQQHATPNGQNNLTIDACRSLSRVMENCPEIFC